MHCQPIDAAEATGKIALFPATLAGLAPFPLHAILCAVGVDHRATADLLIVAPFTNVFFAISKDPRAFAILFVAQS